MKNFLALCLFLASSLSVFAQGYYDVLQSNSGFKAMLYTEFNSDKAEELDVAFDLPSGFDTFKVLGCDLDPFLGYSNALEGYNLLYDHAVQQASQLEDHFLLIIKQLDPLSGEDITRLTYKVFIKWPTTTTYDTLSPVLKEAARKQIEDHTNAFAKAEGTSFPLSVLSEVACIDKMMEKVFFIKTGSFVLDTTNLIDAGFVEIPLDTVTITNTTTSFPSGYDFAGLKVGGEYISDNAYLATSEVFFSVENIFTDNATVLNDTFDYANSIFDSLTSSKIIVWFHYWESSSGNKLFYKYKSNLTTLEATNFINLKLEELADSLEVKSEEPISFYGNSSSRSVPSDCSSWKKWTAKKCLLPYYTDEEYRSAFASASTDFQAGLVCGVIDGLYTSLVGLYDLADIVVEAGSHFPSIYWLGDLYKEIYNAAAFGGYGIAGPFYGIINKIKSDINYWKTLSLSLQAMYTYGNLAIIVSQIMLSIETFFQDITFQNGSLEAGYVTGYIVFEVVMAILTAGGGKAADFLADFARLSKEVFDPQKFRSLIDGLFDRMEQGFKLKFKIGASGCFIAFTPVLMARNPFKNVAPAFAFATMPLAAPIQNVQVDDMVKAYHHEDMSLTASNFTNDMYVPGWQDYDYLDITPETWQVGKFIIEEEDGSLVEIEANRPIGWFEGYKLKEKGDKAFITIKEMGISDYAILQEIRSTHIDTRNFARNEKGKVDRPVITTYKRIANEISDYTFSNGQVISCTPNHPLYSTVQQAYIPVEELTLGETVQTAGEREIKFIGGKLREKGEHVYNFEVWREHNYYVRSEGGEDFVLVHNSCPKIKKTPVLTDVFENWSNTLKSKLNPRRNFDDGKFENHVTGNDIQYEAVGGGEKIWVDGIDINRNALVDAKHNPGDFYTLDSYLEKPFLYGDLEDEFRRYAKVIEDSSNPVAELIIKISNDKEASDLLFKHLGLNYNVPTSVEVVPWTP